MTEAADFPVDHKSLKFSEALPKRGVIYSNDLLNYPEDERHDIICRSPMVEIRRRKSMIETPSKMEYTPLKIPGKKDEMRKITRRLSVSIINNMKSNNNQQLVTPMSSVRTRSSQGDQECQIDKSICFDNIETIERLKDVFNLQRKRLEYAWGDWTCILREEKEKMPEEASDNLRAALGKCHLLLEKKFKFFEDLISKAEEQAKNVKDDCPMVGLDDLLGYFQTVYDQIKLVDKAFDLVDAWRSKDWVVEPKPKTPNRSIIKRVLNKKLDISSKPRSSPKGPSMFAKFLSKRKAMADSKQDETE